MWWDVYGTLAAVEPPVGEGADDRVRCVCDYGFYDLQIWRNRKKYYYTCNYFQLVTFTFKFGLQSTHQKILLAFNFGVAIYLVGKLLSK